MLSSVLSLSVSQSFGSLFPFQLPFRLLCVRTIYLCVSLSHPLCSLYDVCFYQQNTINKWNENKKREKKKKSNCLALFHRNVLSQQYRLCKLSTVKRNNKRLFSLCFSLVCITQRRLLFRPFVLSCFGIVHCCRLTSSSGTNSKQKKNVAWFLCFAFALLEFLLFFSFSSLSLSLECFCKRIHFFLVDMFVEWKTKKTKATSGFPLI